MKKNKLALIMLILFILLQSTLVFAVIVKTKIVKVTITGIDYPYSKGSVLDTTAEVTDDSKSIVSSVKWSVADNGLNNVKVTLRPYINYYYASGEVTATVNGNSATNVEINEDNYLEVSYTFPIDSSQSNPNSSATLRHVIFVQSALNGRIEPSDIRVLHGQSITVKIIPNEGYKIADVIVDGDSVGAVEEYKFTRVKETHKIRAEFEKIEGYEIDEPEDTSETSGEMLENIIENFNFNKADIFFMIINVLFNM